MPPMSFPNNTTGGADCVRRRKHLGVVSRDGTLTIDGVPIFPLFGGTMPGTNGKIGPEHLEQLAKSGISPEFAALRGYETIENGRFLSNAKFAKTACKQTPGMLFPLRRADGSIAGWCYRPDNPRLRNGKPAKYEMPWRQPNVIDVPPGVGDGLGDVDVPLWITEGTKKADCGAARGLCIVAINGVWGWVVKGGSALPDWRDIVLQGRRVILAFDSDVMRNPRVGEALREFAAWLETKGARVEYLHLADNGDGKVGLDDYLVDGHTTSDLYALVKDKPPGDNGQSHGGRAGDGAKFFAKRVGLLALDLADDVMLGVTCGFNDATQELYVYENGLWRPNRNHIESEIARLLGNRYRPAHARAVLDLIRLSPGTARITCDPQPAHINVPNGMLEWATGALLEHSPDYRSTVQLPVRYDPEATCGAFETWLTEVLPPDCYESTNGSEGFIWEVIGYTMYSGNPLHAAVLLYGKGRNGKGTLIRVLKALLGERNCSAVGLHELTENRFRTATLYGKLANLAGDLDSRWIANTAAFKAITGGDLVQAEHKFGHPFEFTPWAFPFYSANKAFGSADSSEGWVSRWTVVPFPNTFGVDPDRGLDAVLQAPDELRGVMARGVRALPALMSRGRFLQPESVIAAKTAFIEASDAVRSWVGEYCTLGFDAWTPRTSLYRAYQMQTCTDGSKLLSSREFYNRIEQISGIVAAKRDGVRGFRGIRLRGGGQ